MAYNMYFCTEERVELMAKSVPGGISIRAVRVANWIIAIVIAIFGVGLGGWSSVSALVSKVDEF